LVCGKCHRRGLAAERNCGAVGIINDGKRCPT
jgi:hypothetical protein